MVSVKTGTVIRANQQGGGSGDQRDKGNRRVYDSAHKDYHNWDSNEDQSWRQYLSDHHRKYQGYSRASKSEQSDNKTVKMTIASRTEIVIRTAVTTITRTDS